MMRMPATRFDTPIGPFAIARAADEIEGFCPSGRAKTKVLG